MLFTAYAFAPYAWQAAVIEAWLAVDASGRWAASRCGLLVPRQNGKTALVCMRALFGLVVLGERIAYTAHQQKTATETFEALDAVFKHPDLAKLLQGKPKRALGREEIRLKNGGRVKFIARTRSSGLGFTIDLLVVDEAQEATDAQVAALLPTVSASPRGNPQAVYCGVAPDVDSPGEVFRRIRERGLRKSRRLAWHEWSVESLGDVTDRRRWEAANPSLGRQIKGATVQDELESMAPDTFARQRLCWWPTGDESRRLIDKAAWDRLAVDASPEGRLAYGVRFNYDGSIVSLAVAVRPDAGKAHIELVKYQSARTIEWLVRWLVERKDRPSVIVVDGKAGAQALVDRLREERVPAKAIHALKPSEAIASSARLINAVEEGSLTHFGQPALNEAVYNTAKRLIGKDGGWGFTGLNSADVTPVEACALALWGVMTTKRDPRRKQRIG